MNKEINQAIELLKSAITICDTFDEENMLYATFACGEKEIVIKKYSEYEQAMGSLFTEVVKKEKYVSYEHVRYVIFELCISEAPNIYDNLMDNLSKLELKEYVFIKPMLGLFLKKNDVIKKGKYTFIAKDYIKEYVNSNYKNTDMINYIKHDDMTQFCYVEMKFNAKENIKANEVANLAYNQLDNILRYMLGNNSSYYGLGVFNYRTKINVSSICMCSGQMTITSGKKFTTPPVPISLDCGCFFDLDNGNDKIWYILDKDSYNEIEKRLINSIEWIGMATNEIQHSMAFIQCMFAIESLLQDQEGFITKSISAQICEYIAFLLEENLESRWKLEKRFRKLYKIRSTIAHGTNANAIEKELLEVISLSKQIVETLLTKTELQNITSLEDLRNYVTKLRYS